MNDVTGIIGIVFKSISFQEGIIVESMSASVWFDKFYGIAVFDNFERIAFLSVTKISSA
jgi:hypothetical protein